MQTQRNVFHEFAWELLQNFMKKKLLMFNVYGIFAVNVKQEKPSVNTWLVFWSVSCPDPSRKTSSKLFWNSSRGRRIIWKLRSASKHPAIIWTTRIGRPSLPNNSTIFSIYTTEKRRCLSINPRNLAKSPVNCTKSF